MRGHLIIAAALWVATSLVGYVLVFSFTPFPTAASEQARLIDDAFTLLTLLAVPVFALVVSVVLYSALRFRSKGQPADDGPPMRTHRGLIAGWFGLTTALTIAMIVHPGFTGLKEFRAHDGHEVDLVVKVEARRFAWNAIYPAQGVKSHRELVLPVGATTRFEVTSFDVIHSLWVPAFRVKIDAVPGLVTSVVATPDQVGSFDRDVNFRLQCAELCGVGHALMRLPVRVVEQAEFDAWVAQQKPIQQVSRER